MINISIADNQPVVIHGIKCFFHNHPEIIIGEEFHNFSELESSLVNKNSTVLIIDLELEGLHSVNLLKRIIRNNLNIKILIYTCASEKLFGNTSLKAGAAGFISKVEPLKKLEEALLDIAAGRTAFSVAIHKSALISAKMNFGDDMYRKLSSRESEVLKYLVTGKKNNEISELLCLSEKTISTYKLRLLNKLNVTNLIDLVNKAKTLEIV